MKLKWWTSSHILEHEGSPNISPKHKPLVSAPETDRLAQSAGIQWDTIDGDTRRCREPRSKIPLYCGCVGTGNLTRMYLPLDCRDPQHDINILHPTMMNQIWKRTMPNTNKLMRMSLRSQPEASHNKQPNEAITATPSVPWQGMYVASPDLPPPPAATPIIRHTEHRYMHRDTGKAITSYKTERQTASLAHSSKPGLNPAGPLGGDVDIHPAGSWLPLSHSHALVDKTEDQMQQRCSSDAASHGTHLTGAATATPPPPPMYDVTGWPLGLPQPTHSLTMDCSVHFGRRRGGQFLLCIVHETRQARGQAGREKAVNDDSPSQRQGKEMQIDEPKLFSRSEIGDAMRLTFRSGLVDGRRQNPSHPFDFRQGFAQSSRADEGRSETCWAGCSWGHQGAACWVQEMESTKSRRRGCRGELGGATGGWLMWWKGVLVGMYGRENGGMGKGYFGPMDCAGKLAMVNSPGLVDMKVHLFCPDPPGPCYSRNFQGWFQYSLDATRPRPVLS